MIAYLTHFGAAIAIMLVAGAAYMVVTPYREIALIRAGNTAAAVAFGGTMIGLSVTLFSVLANSAGLLDFVTWGAIALVVQLATWAVLALILRNLRQGITDNKLSYGVFVGTLSIAIGIVNAGAVTY
ncbi:MAG: DUF350 domain-containing protein [Bacteroidales bacterium]